MKNAQGTRIARILRRIQPREFRLQSRVLDGNDGGEERRLVQRKATRTFQAGVLLQFGPHPSVRFVDSMKKIHTKLDRIRAPIRAIRVLNPGPSSRARTSRHTVRSGTSGYPYLLAWLIRDLHSARRKRSHRNPDPKMGSSQISGKWAQRGISTMRCSWRSPRRRRRPWPRRPLHTEHISGVSAGAAVSAASHAESYSDPEIPRRTQK